MSQNLSQTSPGYSLPLIKQKSPYQHGSKSEKVPRYPLLCRNLRNAVINKKHATMSNECLAYGRVCNNSYPVSSA